MHGAFTSLATRRVSGKVIKVAIMKFGSTSFTSTRDWSIAFPGKTNNVGQPQGRGTHRMTTARKEESTSNTRPVASLIRVTHVTTRCRHHFDFSCFHRRLFCGFIFAKTPPSRRSLSELGLEGPPGVRCHWKQLCHFARAHHSLNSRRWARLLSYNHHIIDFRRYFHVSNNKAQHCPLGLFQDSFCWIPLKTPENSLRNLCIFGWRTCVSISCMCKKQTSVSQSSTESEVVTLDCRLRMDGIFAFDLWDVVIDVPLS